MNKAASGLAKELSLSEDKDTIQDVPEVRIARSNIPNEVGKLVEPKPQKASQGRS